MPELEVFNCLEVEHDGVNYNRSFVFLEVGLFCSLLLFLLLLLSK